MAISVVAIHTQPFYGYENIWWYGLYDYIVRLAVPFFFISSAYFLFSKIELVKTKSEKIAVLHRYFFKIFKLYLSWMLLYLPITIYGIHMKNYSIMYSLLLFVRNFLFVGEQWFSWPLWYLLSSLYATVFICILLRFNFKEKWITILLVTILMVSYVITMICNNCNSYNGVLHYFGKILSLVFINGRIFQGIGYFGISYALIRMKDKTSILVNAVILIIGGVLSVLFSFFEITFSDTPLIAITAVALFEITISFVIEKPKKSSIRCRNMSTVVYFTHMIIYFAVGLFWLGFEESDRSGEVSFAVVAIITVCLSFVLVKVKGRIGRIFGW